jgi:nitrogen fixation NifU-like protein
LPLESDLYREVILDHYKDPRYDAPLDNPDAKAEGVNRVCGDELTLTLRIKDGIVVSVGADSKGCSISMASTSMLAEAIEGKTLAEVRERIEQVTGMLTDNPHEPLDEDEDLSALSGVKNYPVRIKCALLPWATLRMALEKSGGMISTEE